MRMDYSLVFLILPLMFHLTHASSSEETDYTPLVEFGNLSKYPTSYEFHTVVDIQEDRNKPGNFLIIEQHALLEMSANGTVNPVVGEADEGGFMNGEGGYAIFQHIGAMSQYNTTDILVTDVRNHCVRNIRRENWGTSTVVGECEEQDCEDKDRDSAEFQSTGVAPLSLKLCFPKSLQYSKRRDKFYIGIFGTSTIYEYDITANYVRVLKYEPEALKKPAIILLGPQDSELYVAHEFAISKFSLDEPENIEIVVGDIDERSASEQYKQIMKSTSLANAVINTITAMLWIIPGQVLLVSEPSSKALRLIDFVQTHTETICMGDQAAVEIVFGPMNTCGFNALDSISLVNSTVYIGDSFGIRKGVDKLILATLELVGVPMCEAPVQPENGSYDIEQVTYHSLEKVTVECDPGFAINTSHHFIQCIGLESKWDNEPPSCRRPSLTLAQPLSGQRAGGTVVVAEGIFPKGTKLVVNAGTELEQILHNTTEDSLEFNFTIPAASSSSAKTAKLAFIFHESIDPVERVFQYTAPPNVFRVSEPRTIMSGGVEINFIGVSLDSAHKYSIERPGKNGTADLRIDEGEDGCIRISNDLVTCKIRDMTELSKDELGGTSFEVMFKGDGVASKNFTLTVVQDPEIIPQKYNQNFMIGHQKYLTASGKRLAAAADKDDYNVTIENVGSCDVILLNDTQMHCIPQEPDLRAEWSLEPQMMVIQVGNLYFSPGNVEFKYAPPTTVKSEEISELKFIIPLVVVFGLVIVMLVILTIYCVNKRKRGKSAMMKVMALNEIPTADGQWYMSLNSELRYRLRDVAIEASDLSYDPMSTPIGKGNFGLIFIGQLRVQGGQAMKTVAVKSLKDSEDITSAIVETFLQEATLLLDLKHINVLNTIGVVWRIGDRPKVILPYMSRGDLRSLVQKDESEFTNGDLLHFAMQVACGMEYLAENKIVHRDLAARNCLVDNTFLVKVADFGLSKDVDEKDYYRDSDTHRPRPIKWMAIESLREGVYTTQSDVWAFGITLWEICVRGTTPYPGIDNSEILRYLLSGQRLLKPSYIHPDIYELMTRCWVVSPETRPTFTELHKFLHQCLETEGVSLADDGQTYSYERVHTREIPSNYVNNDDFVEQILPDYLTPQSLEGRNPEEENEENTRINLTDDRVHGLESLANGRSPRLLNMNPSNDYGSRPLCVPRDPEPCHKMDAAPNLAATDYANV